MAFLKNSILLTISILLGCLIAYTSLMTIANTLEDKNNYPKPALGSGVNSKKN